MVYLFIQALAKSILQRTVSPSPQTKMKKLIRTETSGLILLNVKVQYSSVAVKALFKLHSIFWHGTAKIGVQAIKTKAENR